MKWWGEGRIDTIDRYSDETLELVRDSGCKMIFFGAETGDDARIEKYGQGWHRKPEKQILEFAARMKKVGIVPEYSFVLGNTWAPMDRKETWAHV
jgi:radical SAM superfamily enzyme YgiQ (UPF0313 family)